ncbi:MAG TPA: helix-turn-helix domain-containing protein [Solirubrobacteraceae bacterium]|nr:helix-turn-helix domain-containing protein [Solirubrobacteraceae bacterium]
MGVLVRNRGRLVTDRELLVSVWGTAHGNDAQMLGAHVAQLRRKIEPEEGPRYVKTDPRIGYRFAI